MEMFAIPGVGGIIEKSIEGKDYILVQKRCKENYVKEYGLLEIPAGKIREFENVFNCLRREIKEETGLEVTEILGEEESEVLVANDYRVLSYTPFTCAQNIEGEYPIIVQIFICRAEGELFNSSNESQELRWINLVELKKIINSNEEKFYPMHINTLKKYLKFKGL